MREGDTYIGATESGAVVFIGKKRGTEWRCLPDTMDPRGPKGK
jgi:hypothetical protein